MNPYFLVYGIAIILTLISGLLVWRRYRNPSGFFFFLVTASISGWFALFFAFMANLWDASTLILMSRADFAIGIIGLYSLFFFISFFSTKREKLLTPKVVAILVAYVILLTGFIGTNAIVSGLVLDSEWIYREVYGDSFYICILLYILGLGFFIYASRTQLINQTHLNRVRLKHILFSGLLTMSSGILLELILPLFNIWIFQKELIFIYLVFTVYTYHTLKRYYFPIGYGISRPMVVVWSIVISTLTVNILHNLPAKFWSFTGTYWNLNDRYAFTDSILAILMFMVTYQFLWSVFLSDGETELIRKKLFLLRKNISRATNIIDLNTTISKGLVSILKARWAEIWVDGDRFETLKNFFEADLADPIFINDLVFFEDRKKIAQKWNSNTETWGDVMLAFPIFEKNGSRVCGILTLWTKSLGDFYNQREIELLRDLALFLESHFRYIRTYEKIRELSIHLDQKVDEKTIEYNNLINKQKEFISVISHEIKSPIATAIFQADSILDDLKNNTLSKEDMTHELDDLCAQLVKTGNLLARLFAIQYFETHTVTLFKEKVSISRLLQDEIDIYTKMNESIHFRSSIDPKMWFVEIDRIQFHQVISNLLGNAIKFANPKNPSIFLEAQRKNKMLVIAIEDNGPGLKDIDPANLFEKYSTGKWWMTGLGMGLYLCRQIIQMHNGTIRAEKGRKLEGARFVIEIPTE